MKQTNEWYLNYVEQISGKAPGVAEEINYKSRWSYVVAKRSASKMGTCQLHR